MQTLSHLVQMAHWYLSGVAFHIHCMTKKVPQLITVWIIMSKYSTINHFSIWYNILRSSVRIWASQKMSAESIIYSFRLLLIWDESNNAIRFSINCSFLLISNYEKLHIIASVTQSNILACAIASQGIAAPWISPLTCRYPQSTLRDSSGLNTAPLFRSVMSKCCCTMLQWSNDYFPCLETAQTWR